jgi:hypothetical protein
MEWSNPSPRGARHCRDSRPRIHDDTTGTVSRKTLIRSLDFMLQISQVTRVIEALCRRNDVVTMQTLHGNEPAFPSDQGSYLKPSSDSVTEHVDGGFVFALMVASLMSKRD